MVKIEVFCLKICQAKASKLICLIKKEIAL